MHGSATVKELAQPFPMALPSFLKHIGVLESSQLIVCHKQGRVRTCSLARETLGAAERWFEEQNIIWQSRYANLDALLQNVDLQKNDD